MEKTLINDLHGQFICERCENVKDEIFACERCEVLICHDCQASYDQFSQIDYNCCTSCANQE